MNTCLKDFEIISEANSLASNWTKIDFKISEVLQLTIIIKKPMPNNKEVNATILSRKAILGLMEYWAIWCSVSSLLHCLSSWIHHFNPQQFIIKAHFTSRCNWWNCLNITVFGLRTIENCYGSIRNGTLDCANGRREGTGVVLDYWNYFFNVPLFPPSKKNIKGLMSKVSNWNSHKYCTLLSNWTYG